MPAPLSDNRNRKICQGELNSEFGCIDFMNSIVCTVLHFLKLAGLVWM